MTISFDLWGTLIKSNPEFKAAKNDLIRKVSEQPNKDLLNDYFINDVISQIKIKHDSLIEYYGTQPNTQHLFAELCESFSIPASKFDDFYGTYQNLLKRFPPLLYNEFTLPVLKELQSDGHIIIISSNTLFTGAFPLDAAIRSLGILPYSCRFSGSMGISKPDRRMFNTTASIHVGDNIRTDGACVKAGLTFFQINSNDKTINDLYHYVSLRKKD